ncbi:MAG TPA: LamG domain-containing protein, partial [Lacipirellulaceae bacterium]|nr:LamG domain-containing protein [Lacipirellulaceae bacterium]
GITQNFAGSGWHHLAAVFHDHDTCKLYVDGVEKASTSTTGSIVYTQGTKTVIGAHGNGQTTYDFTGKIDDVRIYSRALCPSEILALKNGGSMFGGVKIIKWVEIQ